MIVERVTGRSYATEARRDVLVPLRLHGTSFPGTRTTLPDPHGRAYTRDGGAGDGGARRDVTDLNPSSAGAAGELISTLGDLTRLLPGLLRGKVVPRAELRPDVEHLRLRRPVRHGAVPGGGWRAG